MTLLLVFMRCEVKRQVCSGLAYKGGTPSELAPHKRLSTATVYRLRLRLNIMTHHSLSSLELMVSGPEAFLTIVFLNSLLT